MTSHISSYVSFATCPHSLKLSHRLSVYLLRINRSIREEGKYNLTFQILYYCFRWWKIVLCVGRPKNFLEASADPVLSTKYGASTSLISLGGRWLFPAFLGCYSNKYTTWKNRITFYKHSCTFLNKYVLTHCTIILGYLRGHQRNLT